MKPQTYRDSNLKKSQNNSPQKTNKEFDDHIEMINLKP